MDENSYAELGSDPAWQALGRRLAVGSGALFALLSLLRDTSVQLAALRGAGVLLAVSLVWRLGTLALAHALAADVAQADGADEAAHELES